MALTFTEVPNYNMIGGNHKIVDVVDDGGGAVAAVYKHNLPWTPEVVSFMPTSSTFYNNQPYTNGITDTNVIVQSLGAGPATWRMLLSRTRGD